MGSDDLHARLMALANEMLTARGMPSDFMEDWDLPKSTPVSVWRKIKESSERANSSAVNWGRRVKAVADALAPPPTLVAYRSAHLAYWEELSTVGYDLAHVARGRYLDARRAWLDAGAPIGGE